MEIVYVCYDVAESGYLNRLFLPLTKEFGCLGGGRPSLVVISRTGILFYRDGEVTKVSSIQAIAELFSDDRYLLARGPAVYLALLFLKLITFSTGQRIYYDCDGLEHLERKKFSKPYIWPLFSLGYYVGLSFSDKVFVRTTRYLRRGNFLERFFRHKYIPVYNPAPLPIHASTAIGSRVEACPSNGSGPVGKKYFFCYVGSMGPQYCPTDVLSLLGHSLRSFGLPSVAVLKSAMSGKIVNAISPGLRGIDVRYDEGPQQIKEILDASVCGICLRDNSKEMEAVFPLKLLDYLASGLFVITNQRYDLVSEIFQVRIIETGIHADIDDTLNKVGLESLREKILHSAYCKLLTFALFSPRLMAQRYILGMGVKK